MNKKLVFGVGVMDADYAVQKNITILVDGKRKQKRVWACPLHGRWVNLLRRCYCPKSQKLHPTYLDCTVCADWLYFSKFRAWMVTQDWEGKELDKDVLYHGNKVYSPDTCVFVDRDVNLFLTERAAERGKFMIGVYWRADVGKFLARCSDGNGKQQYLGLFATEIDAHKAWLAFKLDVAYKLAGKQTDPRIAKALVDRYENYTAA